MPIHYHGNHIDAKATRAARLHPRSVMREERGVARGG